MTDISDLLKRQAEWQRSRKTLSWPEKIRIAETIRPSVLQLRTSGLALKGSGTPDKKGTRSYRRRRSSEPHR